jgi:hypothetical protein
LRIKHTSGAAASLVHDGKTFEPEEDGYFRIPFDLAQSLLLSPDWEAEPATAVVPEPAPEQEQEDGTEELTPAQKGALTKAANAAKAAAEAEAK